ncbi:DUF4225 domain-containing protein [Xenorhabdus griffiniae]|uniref:DUF4225 domain-containing protein n=1 Tax=Xenorhabdus griffiniae TaxID=351672 RepID=UPI003B589836
MLEFLTPRGAWGKEYSYHFETLFKRSWHSRRFITNSCRNRPNKGLVRLGYENTFEYLGSSKTTGSLVYTGVDLSLSAHALLSRTLKPDAWRLFHHINEDYVHGYKLMSGYALGF